jgi:hypothetical protein
MRPSHTTKDGRAECLNYRDGSRCGRLGRTLVEFYDHQGRHQYPVCDECRVALVAEYGARVLGENRAGYKVRVTGYGGLQGREYIEVS